MHPLLAAHFPELCSWDAHRASRAVKSLRRAVEDAGDEAPGPSFTALLQELDNVAVLLVHGSSGGASSLGAVAVERVLGGVRTLEALVQVADGHAASGASNAAGGAERRMTFAVELRVLLEGWKDGDARYGDARYGSGDGWALLDAVTEAAGAVAKASGAELEVVEAQMAAPAMEWLKADGTRGEARRYAAVQLLRQLAAAAPTVLYERRKAFFDDIWNAVNDPKQQIRVRAAAALGAMLQLVHERDSTDRYCRVVLREVENGFARDTPFTVHGSLLTIGQLLEHPGPWMAFARPTMPAAPAAAGAGAAASGVGVEASVSAALGAAAASVPGAAPAGKHSEPVQPALAVAGTLALAGSAAPPMEKYKSFCKHVLSKRDHRERCVRHTVMATLPQLAYFAPRDFSEYLEHAVWFLMHTIRQGDKVDRRLAYHSLARLGEAVGASLIAVPTAWHSVLTAVREGLGQRDGSGGGGGGGGGSGSGGGGARSASERRYCSSEVLGCVRMVFNVVGAAADPPPLGFPPVITAASPEPSFAELAELAGDAFEGGLSSALVAAVTVAMARAPALQPLLQERMLREVAEALQAFVAAGGGSLAPPLPPPGAATSSSDTGLAVSISGLSPHGGRRAVGLWRPVAPAAPAPHAAAAAPHSSPQGLPPAPPLAAVAPALAAGAAGAAAVDPGQAVRGQQRAWEAWPTEEEASVSLSSQEEADPRLHAALALQVLGCFDFYSTPPPARRARSSSDAEQQQHQLPHFHFLLQLNGDPLGNDESAAAAAAQSSEEDEEQAAQWAAAAAETASREHEWRALQHTFWLLHAFALRCADDVDAAVRQAACVACCGLLDRAVRTAEGFGGNARDNSPPQRFSAASAAAAAAAGASASGKRRGEAVVAAANAAARHARGAAVAAATWEELSCARVLERLLTAGLADESHGVRASVFASLAASRWLDRFVAVAANVHCLFDALSSAAAFDVQRAAAAVICRAARHRPAAIMPLLRRALVLLIKQLEAVSYDAGLRREKVILLTDVVHEAGPLVRPYVPSLLRPLLAELQRASPAGGRGITSDVSGGPGPPAAAVAAVAAAAASLDGGGGGGGSGGVGGMGVSGAGGGGGVRASGSIAAGGASPPPPLLVAAVLSAVGALAAVSPEDARPLMDTVLLPAAAAALADTASVAKQAAAMHALGQLADATGWVVEPYFKQPPILTLTLAALQRPDPAAAALRAEAVRTVGILGAIDPVKRRLYHAYLRRYPRRAGERVGVGGARFLRRRRDLPVVPEPPPRVAGQYWVETAELLGPPEAWPLSPVRQAAGAAAAAVLELQAPPALQRLQSALPFTGSGGGGNDGHAGAISPPSRKLLLQQQHTTMDDGYAHGGGGGGRASHAHNNENDAEHHGHNVGVDGGGVHGEDMTLRIPGWEALDDFELDEVGHASGAAVSDHEGIAMGGAAIGGGGGGGGAAGGGRMPGATGRLSAASASGRMVDRGPRLPDGLDLEEYLPRVAVSALLKVLRDPLLSAHYQAAVAAAMSVFRRLRPGAGLDLLGQLVSCFVAGIRRTDVAVTPVFRVLLFRQLEALLDVAAERQAPPAAAVATITSVVLQHWEAFLAECLATVHGLHRALGPEGFRLVLPDVMPLLLASLKAERDAGQRVCWVIRLVARLADSLEEHVLLFLPVLLRILERKENAYEPRRLALLAALRITAGNPYFLDCSARFVHALLRLVRTAGAAAGSAPAAGDSDVAGSGGGGGGSLAGEGPSAISGGLAGLAASEADAADLRRLALVGLCCMVCRLGQGFVPYVAAAREHTASARGTKAYELYWGAASKLLRQQALPLEPAVPEIEALMSGPFLPTTSDRRPSFAGGATAVLSHTAAAAAAAAAGAVGATSAAADPVRRGSLSAAAGSGGARVSGDLLPAVLEGNVVPGEPPVNAAAILAVMDTSACNKPSDWVEWVRRVGVELLRQSPAPSLRACASLALAYQPLAQELFNAAFISLWDELDEWGDAGSHAPILAALESALRAPSLPPEILSQVLNLAEFMELEGKALPLDEGLLAARAEAALALAKFLHCKEKEFLRQAGTDDFFGYDGSFPSAEGRGGDARASEAAGQRHARQMRRKARGESAASSAADSDAGGPVPSFPPPHSASTVPAMTGSPRIGGAHPQAGASAEHHHASAAAANSAAAGGTSGQEAAALEGGGGGGASGGLSLECVEALISVNHRLGLRHAASGILRFAELHSRETIVVRPSWLEKLNLWDQALALYEERERQLAEAAAAADSSGAENAAAFVAATAMSRLHAETEDSTDVEAADAAAAAAAASGTVQAHTDPEWVEVKLGQLRCLDALGDYERAHEAAQQLWRGVNDLLPPQPVALLQQGGLGAAAAAAGRSYATAAAAAWLTDGSMHQQHLSGRSRTSTQTSVGSATSSTGSGWLGSFVRSSGTPQHLGGLAAAAQEGVGPLAHYHQDEWRWEVETLGARAAWMLGKWDVLEEYAASPATSAARGHMNGLEDKIVLEAVVALQRGDFDAATHGIAEARAAMAPSLASLLGESYGRAYSRLVTVQELAELEEIVQYKRLLHSGAAAFDRDGMGAAATAADGRHGSSHGGGGGAASGAAAYALRNLRHKWELRLRWAAEDTDVWRRILAVRSIVARPEDDVRTWLKLASLSRKHNNTTLCANTLRAVGAVLPPPPPAVVLASSSSAASGVGGARNPALVDPRVWYAVYKLMWAKGEHTEALAHLEGFTDKLASRVVPGGLRSPGGAHILGQSGASGGVPDRRLSDLLVRCLRHCSQWKLELLDRSGDAATAGAAVAQERDAIQAWLQAAIELEPTNYKAWHAWALFNYRLADDTDSKLQQQQLQQQEEQQQQQLKLQSSLGPSQPGPQLVSPRPLPLVKQHSVQHFMPQQQQQQQQAGARSPAEVAIRLLSRDVSSSNAESAHDSNNSNQREGELEAADGAQLSPSITPSSTPRGATPMTPPLVPPPPMPPLPPLPPPLLSASSPSSLLVHTVDAIRGFFRSISLGQDQPVSSVLQDTLRLLTLWFSHSGDEAVTREMAAGFGTVPVDTWLGVVPQLIARIHTRTPQVASLLRQVLVRIGRRHPQALIYPITVASMSSSRVRQEAAKVVMGEMHKSNPVLVGEASLVSHELVKVAVTLAELWHEGLEEASRMYFGDKDVEGTLARLQELHALVDGGGGTHSLVAPDTLRNVSFLHSFGRDLAEALEWMQRFRRTRVAADLHQAWDIYYHVFRRITRQLSNLKTLELRHVAPALPNARDLQLAVPGTYRAHFEVTRIQSFAPSAEVITWSKQRPRRMTVYGSNGRAYMFLLKGREDLRQDERVMQLFGLMNALLRGHRGAADFNVSIQRYAVMPLSSTSGVIGWVPNCDTLHQLIRQYRESKEMRLNMEHKLMMAAAPDYDKLPLLNKLEVFVDALRETDGQDVAQMLWLKSESSEVWLDRRTNYTRSLAVMSMAGYVLGLGDRHPSNLMLDRVTGRFVHIDFSDCFEVAMHRDKFPEKVPFRLTRMLVNAMEVSRIEGSFRSTCEHVMRVLRANRDSLMAMLEAFVHDPLISWRLLAPAHISPSYQSHDGGGDGGGGGGGGRSGGGPNGHGDDSDEDEYRTTAVDAESVSQQYSERGPGPFRGDFSRQQSSDTASAMGVSGAGGGHSRVGGPAAGGAPGTMHAAAAIYRSRSSPVKTSHGGGGGGGPHGGGGGHEGGGGGGPSGGGGGGMGGGGGGGGTASAGVLFGAHEGGANATGNDMTDAPEQLSERAVQVIQRIHTKLIGRDFCARDGSFAGGGAVGMGSPRGAFARGADGAGGGGGGSDGNEAILSVPEQVDRLIQQAVDVSNLCQLFVGWCPFW